mmetsp:Transcript_20587/g.57229  ORF Transcript_20587/g.57229 Transcript_20587/m.57229 type:complete len:181 (+) Transcript_20587:2-544(+)
MPASMAQALAPNRIARGAMLAGMLPLGRRTACAGTRGMLRVAPGRHQSSSDPTIEGAANAGARVCVGGPATPARRHVVLAGVVAVAGGAAASWYWWETQGRATVARRQEREAREAEWRRSLAELRAYYAEQPGVKGDPAPGTSLAYFVAVNRARRELPTYGLAEWQIQELEAVDGWKWEE